MLQTSYKRGSKACPPHKKSSIASQDKVQAFRFCLSTYSFRTSPYASVELLRENGMQCKKPCEQMGALYIHTDSAVSAYTTPPSKAYYI